MSDEPRAASPKLLAGITHSRLIEAHNVSSMKMSQVGIDEVQILKMSLAMPADERADELPNGVELRWGSRFAYRDHDGRSRPVLWPSTRGTECLVIRHHAAR